MSLLSGCQQLNPQPEALPHPDSPLRVALDAMNHSFRNGVRDLLITQHVSGGEFPTAAVITVEESGLLDDSISAQRTVFSMAYLEGRWVIERQTKAQKCYPGRGHQDFADKRCL
ncbi:hypothetical protein BFW87_25410 [Pseudomonas fluorescens]|uniref:Lipoprotein n=1 Tax=Pseudomonas fluorescens TaxID=294 RepID=A0A1T2Y2X2_PSEFL|nr:hypothetical protein BFW87_25410 [Pseudomonas fluorescens]